MKKLIILSMLGSAAASAAFASATVVVTFTALPGTTGNGTTNSSQGSTYNGGSAATIAGIANESLVCDNFDNTTDVPSSQIDFSVETISSLAGANFTSGYAAISGDTLSEVQAYDTAAVLMTGLEALAVNSTNAQAIADYNYAIWNLMLPGGTDGAYLDSPLDSNAIADQQNAFAAVRANSLATQADERSLVIYTPTAGFTSNQEFLGLNTPLGTAPEPSTWVLLAGLGLLLGVKRARAAQSK